MARVKAVAKAAQTRRLPLLTLRGMVLFPKMVLHFDVGREKSIFALNEAMNNDRLLFLAAQRDVRDEEPDGEDIYDVGVVAEIRQIIKSGGGLRVLVEGLYRAKLVELRDENTHFTTIVEEYPTKPLTNRARMTDALMRTLKDLFEEHSSMTPRMTNRGYARFHAQHC